MWTLDIRAENVYQSAPLTVQMSNHQMAQGIFYQQDLSTTWSERYKENAIQKHDPVQFKQGGLQTW